MARDPDEERFEALEAEVFRLTRGEHVADDVPPERKADVTAARQRVTKLRKCGNLSKNAFAEKLGVDWKAIDMTEKDTGGIAVPWWIEKLIREEPLLALELAADITRDSKVSFLAKKRASNG